MGNGGGSGEGSVIGSYILVGGRLRPPLPVPPTRAPMIFDRMDERPGARLLLVLACLVILVAGLKAAAVILVPFVLALFLAVVSMPVMFWFRRKGMWEPAAIALTILLNVLL